MLHEAVSRNLEDLLRLGADELLGLRQDKWRKIGNFFDETGKTSV